MRSVLPLTSWLSSSCCLCRPALVSQSAFIYHRIPRTQPLLTTFATPRSLFLSLSLVFLTFSVSVSICLFPIHRKWFTPQVPSSSLILFDPVHNLLFVGCAKNDLSVCLSRDSNKEPFVRVEGHQRQPNALFASIIFCFGVFLVDTPSFIVNRY